jgi:hypothetical protein
MDEIIKAMVNHYGDLRAYARGCLVDIDEVNARLEEATPDTAEFVVLKALQDAHTKHDGPAELPIEPERVEEGLVRVYPAEADGS